MANGSHVSSPAAFDTKGDPSQVSVQWQRWKRGFEYYFAARGNTEDGQKRALLLHCAGLDVQDIFETLSEVGTTYREACTKLDDYFKPAVNSVYERHVFRQLCPQHGETTMQFSTRLKQQAKLCDFGDKLEENVRDQLIDKCSDRRLKAKFLEKGALTLTEAIDLARAHENAQQQVRNMDSDRSVDNDDVVCKVKNQKSSKTTFTTHKHRPHSSKHTHASSRSGDMKCYRCGKEGHFAKDSVCPARGRVCKKCNKRGHFAVCCKSQVKFVHKEDSEEDSDQFADARNDFAFLMSCDVHDVSHNDDTFVDAHDDGDVCLDANDDEIYVDSEDDDDDEYYDAQDDHTHYTQADAQVGRTHGTQADVVDDIQGYENNFAFSIAHSAYPESVDLNVGTVPLSAVIDSGASINILDQETWEMLKKKNIKCTSQKTNGRKLFAYGHEKPLSVLGTFQAEVFVVGHEQNRQRCEFVVISEKGVTLLGKESAEKLNVLRVGLPNDVHTCSVTEKPENKAEFSDLFKGLGKLKNKQIKLHVKKDVKPVVQKARRIPFSLRQKVEKKIKELEALDIIERADGPTSFVSPIVVVPKPNGDVRLCVDMRQANEAIQRERFPIPTVEETLIEMNGSKVFSKLDLNMGFHQIELDEASRPITTFTTHAGLFRYKRLMFGVSSAPEIYQYTIQQVLKDCPGSKNMTDDIIIYADSVEEHDRRLEKVLTTLKENGLTLNKDKCVYRMDQLQFMGFLLSEKGIGPSSEKVKAVRNAERPKSASEVRSFLGLVNFNARFIPDLATKSEALRKLTRKDNSFKWGTEQEKAFQTLKDDLAKATELAYFDPQAPTKIIADASPVGLGAVLIQTQAGVEKPIYYASRSLTDVEQRYSQTEKEALALVWACERFHQYIFGIHFVLETDHKPLEFIYSKRSKPSLRIERWVLRLQSYHFVVKYKPGNQNIADPLSRLVKPKEQNKTQQDEVESYIYSVVREAVPCALTPREVEEVSAVDGEMTQLRECIQTGKWERCSNQAYKTVKDELTSLGKLVLRGSRIVIPEKLRQKVIDLAHEGHQGIVKTKERLRTKVWWPGIDRDTEKRVKSCHACQVVSQPSRQEPMTRKKFPDGPWEDLAIDILGPLPSGESILVTVDYYSRYFEATILRATQTKHIVTALENVFTTHGLPVSVTTDNGPQFVSDEFSQFLKNQGIEHHHTTPLWPQANGEVERQNRTIMKAIRTAQAENKDWKRELNTFLLAYRTTPHQTTGVSPAELLFGRKLRTKLPELNRETKDGVNEAARDRDSLKKELGKQYTDSHRHAKESSVTVGDEVLLQQRKQDKFSTHFEPVPYKVVEKTGSQVTIQSKTGTPYKRNVSHTKPYIRRSDTQTTDTPGTPGQMTDADKQPDNSEDASPGTQSDMTEIKRPDRIRKPPSKFDDFIVGIVRGLATKKQKESVKTK